MKATRVGSLLAAVLLAAPATVEAWSPPTRVRMVDEAVRLMPASLRLALERHRDAVLRGALDPMREESGDAHRPPWGGGRLDAEVAARAKVLVDAVEAPASFRDIARRFGELAHFVADAGFPPGAGGADGDPHYADFAEFCESRLDRIPLVFYGHESADLDRGDVSAFALAAMQRARVENRDLARVYATAGNPPDPAAFDDRSVPFAVASLAYSHTVTDIARAWLSAWARAGGDLGRTPYLRRLPAAEPR